MPFLNGLELVEKVKEILPNCIIIIISGYDEFSYVQKALKLKVFDYLLKPVSQDTLKSTIENALVELNKKKTENDFTIWREKNGEENILVVKEIFLNKLILNELNEKEIIENLHFFKISDRSLMGILLIQPIEKEYIGNVRNEWSTDLLMDAIKNITQELLKEYECNVFINTTTRSIVAFSSIEDKNEWNKIGNTIKDTVGKYLKETIVVGQAECGDRVSRIHVAYEKLLQYVVKESKCNPFALRLKSFIRAHYYENDFGAIKVAEQFNVSPTYVSRILKAETGNSFIDYLTNVRIENAIKIMSDPTVKICEVSELVGYSSQHYFSKAFKKTTGESPIKYREEKLLR